MSRKSLGCAIALAFVTGCSGGGGTTQPVQIPATQAPSKNTTIVEAKIVLPKSKKSAGRKRNYTSPSTAGLVVAVLQETGSATTPYSTTGYNLTTNTATSTCSVSSSTGDTTCLILFNAPVTSATQTDLFYIYAYDTAQTVGTLPASYTPAGDLLSEDTGIANAGDPVPAGTASGNGAIVSGSTNSVLFVLKPVVATPVASIDGTFAGSKVGLVLSVPGSGGQSNTLSIDGYDADDNEIISYLVAGSGDDVYVNPIQDTVSPATFVLSASPVTSAANDFISVTYTPAVADQPVSSTSTAPKGTIQISDSLANGGFGDHSSLPTAGQAVTVAPLFAYASTSSVILTGFSTSVYAMQAVVPTSYAGYSLTAQPTSGTNDCSAYSIAAPTAGASGTSQQAVFGLQTTASPAVGTTCTLVLSDSLSTTDITFNPDGTHTP